MWKPIKIGQCGKYLQGEWLQYDTRRPLSDNESQLESVIPKADQALLYMALPQAGEVYLFLMYSRYEQTGFKLTYTPQCEQVFIILMGKIVSFTPRLLFQP